MPPSFRNTSQKWYKEAESRAGCVDSDGSKVSQMDYWPRETANVPESSHARITPERCCHRAWTWEHRTQVSQAWGVHPSLIQVLTAQHSPRATGAEVLPSSPELNKGFLPHPQTWNSPPPLLHGRHSRAGRAGLFVHSQQ